MGDGAMCHYCRRYVCICECQLCGIGLPIEFAVAVADENGRAFCCDEHKKYYYGSD